MTHSIFRSNLASADPAIAALIEKEFDRQNNEINLIASENIASEAVLDAMANITTNKYAEGYPGKRYYAGCENVDQIELLAIERAKQLFKCEYANVQPHAGCQANQAVFLAFLNPGDTILGMDLNAGGHLTHGAAPSLSGKWFNAIHYGVDDNGFINYDAVLKLAKEHKPKMLIAGASAYSRHIDFKAMKEISASVGALFMADVAHYSGLIVAGQYPSPFPHADIVTTTTHKTLRGPRGGMIMTNNPDYAKKINSAIFPGLQGGPLMNTITAKAVAFGEALRPKFVSYAEAVIANARQMAAACIERGYKVVTGGTDCHMFSLDLSGQSLCQFEAKNPLDEVRIEEVARRQSVEQQSVHTTYVSSADPYSRQSGSSIVTSMTGKAAEVALTECGIICNKNTVPNEKQSPFITSGIRLGSPTCTTRGFGVAEFEQIGHLICDVLDATKASQLEQAKPAVLEKVSALCKHFPIYSGSR